jgi:hypothetical protein
MSVVVRIGIGALLLAAAIWFMNATEWVETEVPVPPKGEAAHDPLYAARKLLAGFGMQVQSRTSLDALPPRGARLLLTSSYWAMLSSRPKQLQEWVRNGGHLVIPASIIDRDELGWAPIITGERPTPASSGKTPRPAPAVRDCRKVQDGSRTLELCGWPHWRTIGPANGTAVQWQLQGPTSTEALRVPFGAGTVTVVGPRATFENRQLLRADNPLVFAAAMQAERGAPVWVVSEESREHLVPWLWHQGWVALVLLLGAIGAGLWRSAVRFGPLASHAQPQRRSMAEQVAGTARFLHKRAPQALHSAQLKALHETAVDHLPGYAAADARTRAAKLAAATGMAQAALEDAMLPARETRPLAARIQLMETARRRLVSAHPFRSKDDNHADQT